MTVTEFISLANNNEIDFTINDIFGTDYGTCKKDYIKYLESKAKDREISSYTIDKYDDGTPYIRIWVK